MPCPWNRLGARSIVVVMSRISNPSLSSSSSVARSSVHRSRTVRQQVGGFSLFASGLRGIAVPHEAVPAAARTGQKHTRCGGADARQIVAPGAGWLPASRLRVAIVGDPTDEPTEHAMRADRAALLDETLRTNEHDAVRLGERRDRRHRLLVEVLHKLGFQIDEPHRQFPALLIALFMSSRMIVQRFPSGISITARSRSFQCARILSVGYGAVVFSPPTS